MTDTDELRRLYEKYGALAPPSVVTKAWVSLPSLLDELDRLRTENKRLLDRIKRRADVLEHVAGKHTVEQELAETQMERSDAEIQLDEARRELDELRSAARRYLACSWNDFGEAHAALRSLAGVEDTNTTEQETKP